MDSVMQPSLLLLNCPGPLTCSLQVTPGRALALCPFPCSRLLTLSVLDPCSLLFISTICIMLFVSHSESVLTFSGTSFIFHPHCKLEFQDLFQVVILVLLRRVLIYEPPTFIGVFLIQFIFHFNMNTLVLRFYLG